MSKVFVARTASTGSLKQVVLALLLLGFAAALNSALAARTADPLSLYGNKLSFDVFRNGERVGRHDVSFTRKPNGKLRVNTRFELKITFLTFTVYDYLYQSTAIWRNGHLTALDADVIEDDRKTSVRATLGPDGMEVSGPNKQVRWHGKLYPTNHWNAGVLTSNEVLNTISGEVSRVTIENLGREKIRAEGLPIEAVKYQYSGDLNPTVWYDNQGRWVKFRFNAKDGSTIEYECTRCGISVRPETKSG